jgi:hypothetical protein
VRRPELLLALVRRRSSMLALVRRRSSMLALAPSRRGRRIALAALMVAALAPLLAPRPARAEDSPHHMVLPNGKLDESKCGACHTKDMSLIASPLETCTLCHSEWEHSGAHEHVTAPKDKVAALMAKRAKGAVELPTPDGQIYCGTCHLYHDPKVLDEEWLKVGWIPPDTGIAGAVRASVLERWAKLDTAGAKQPVGEFATTGTRQLRLPVSDGSLCVQCHGDKR